MSLVILRIAVSVLTFYFDASGQWCPRKRDKLHGSLKVRMQRFGLIAKSLIIRSTKLLYEC